MKPILCKVIHPQTPGKIEPYLSSMKNIVERDHFYNPNEPLNSLDILLNPYNRKRYHESLYNLASGYIYRGKKNQILR